MLINTFLDTEDFVHLYYPEDEPTTAQGCGAGARMASKYPARPPSPDYSQVSFVNVLVLFYFFKALSLLHPKLFTLVS